MAFTDEDIDEWVKKTSAVEKAIRGIADGDYNTVNLGAFDIELPTQDEEVLEEEERENVREKNSINKAAKLLLEKQKERENWWEGAKLLFVSGDGCASSPCTVAVSVRMQVSSTLLYFKKSQFLPLLHTTCLFLHRYRNLS
jgi:hypothetical protein